MPRVRKSSASITSKGFVHIVLEHFFFIEIKGFHIVHGLLIVFFTPGFGFDELRGETGLQQNAALLQILNAPALRQAPPSCHKK